MKALIAWAQATRPARVFAHFGARSASVLAGGMAYSAIFSIFAGIWLLFSVAGIFLATNTELRDGLIGVLNSSLPGLIGEDGAIDPSLLENTGAFGWASTIALIGTLGTALGWLGQARTGIRTIFDVPVATKRSFVVQKLIDLGFLLAFAVALAISAALTVLSSTFLSSLLSTVGIDESSGFALVVIRIVTVLILLGLDTVVLAGILRILAGLRIPTRSLFFAAFLGAIVIGILKQISTALIGGATSNPLVASFAVLLGLMIFLNLLCTVLLLTAAWVKVTMDDIGASPRLLTAKEAREESTDTILRAEREKIATEVIEARERLNAAPRFFRWKAMAEYRTLLRQQRRVEAEAQRRRFEGGRV
ncbi:YihY/virulence factor BrkB family protein [Pseudoclavibacter helvolus]|nr:YihY/virulence factor BrkB family protein [Pseudoclavibacter helvolus]